MSDLDLLVSQLSAAKVRVYKFGSVPVLPSYPYAVISPAPGAPTVRTLAGQGDPLGRFTVQVFGETADSLLATADKTYRAFERQELTGFDGAPVAWQEIATPPYRDPDTTGVLNITHTYRF